MTKSTTNDTTLHLTFKIDQELLALNVSRVREVLDLPPITRVPRTSEFMRGVTNLRGSVIPVLDLRLKFGLSKTESSIDARIVVTEIEMKGEKTVVGVLTDSVHDVIEIAPDQIDTSPLMGKQWRMEFIKGVGKYEDKFILLLDINRVFSTEEISSVEALPGDQENPLDRVN